jgi:hypothetical protein
MVVEGSAVAADLAAADSAVGVEADSEVAEALAAVAADCFRPSPRQGTEVLWYVVRHEYDA